ncbi:MAG: hypothetical protein K2K54_02650 [Lachnospiraceae bacterium]|nr:hypothetical protein [Lachnospiraceae bacterium]
MSFRKNWFGCIMWAVYSAVLCMFLATYLNVQCTLHKLGKQETVFIVCAAFCSIFIIYRLFCTGFRNWGYKLSHISMHSKRLWEIFLVLSLFCGAVLARIDWYLHHLAEIYGAPEFNEWAAFMEGDLIFKNLHGASYLYNGILSCLFSFLGKQQFAGIMLQIVFQLSGMLLLYFGIKKLSGTITAIVSMAFMAFLPAVLQQNFILLPENLYFFLFAGMVYLISGYRYKYGKNTKKRKPREIMTLVLLGLGTGYMIYLDIIGVLLLVLSFFVLADMGKKRKRGMDAVILTVVCLAGFLLLLWLQSCFSGDAFLKALFSWKELYFPFSAGYKIAVPDITATGSVLVCIGSAWYVLGFWQEKRDQGGFYVFSLLILLLLVFFCKTNMSYQIFSAFYWSVLASVGIAAVTGLEKEHQNTSGRKEKIQQERSGNTVSMKREAAAPSEEKSINVLAENQDKDVKKDIKFIENPLPLPKKHVKKTMDYRFIPDREQMNYDVEVDKNDDFDLK